MIMTLKVARMTGAGSSKQGPDEETQKLHREITSMVSRVENSTRGLEQKLEVKHGACKTPRDVLMANNSAD